jgi:uncharacterized protein YdeI (YjbR/CyaY-like superfamily)
MNRMNTEVDIYLSNTKKWQEEMEKLRMIILDCQLTEELKWRAPCYTYQKNVCLRSSAVRDWNQSKIMTKCKNIVKIKMNCLIA